MTLAIERRLLRGICQAIVFAHLAYSQPATRTYPVFDPLLRMNAWYVDAPASWKVQAVLLPAGCTNLPDLVVRAYSPDELSGVVSHPRRDWSWESGPAGPFWKTPPPNAACMPFTRAVPARVYMMKYLLPALFNKGLPPHRELDASQELAKTRRIIGPGADLAQVQVQYQINGHPVDEIIEVRTTVTDTAPVVRGAPWLHKESVWVSRMHVPAGKLQDPAIHSVRARIDQQWNQAFKEVLSGNIRRMGEHGMKVLQGMMADTARVMNQEHEAIMQAAQASERSRDISFGNFMYNSQHTTDNVIDNIFDCQRLPNAISIGNYCPDRQTAP